MGSISSLPECAVRRVDEGRVKNLRTELDTYLDRNATDFILTLRADVRHKWDRLVVITGRRGVGKSTLGMQLCKLLDYSFDLNRLAYQPEDLMPIFNRLYELGPYRAMMMDEGGEIWNRADWATKVSKAISKQFIGDRYLYSYRFILAPTIFHLDKKAIDLCDYWIKVYSPDRRTRGYADVRLIGEVDYSNPKIPYSPGFMTIRFDDLPEEVGKQYELFKMQQGRSRSKKYQKIIGEATGTYVPEEGDEEDELDLDRVADEVMAHIDKYLGEDEICKWRLIYQEYSGKGLGQERAKSIATYVNKLRREGWKT